MNRQEIFEKVARHLFTQGVMSKNEDGGCAYRGGNGTSCAIGCLISDEIHKPAMEAGDVYYLLYEFRNISQILPGDELDLLDTLQSVHDNHINWTSTRVMRESLYRAARPYDLDPKILENLHFSDR